MIADMMTISRMIFSAAMLFLAPDGTLFFVLYLLCGLSDAADGFTARILHTESEKGAMLDSAADLLFAVVYAGKLLPLLSLPKWVWIWTAIIALVKLTGILLKSQKERRFCIRHSLANKLTGLLIFLLPLTLPWLDGRYGAGLVCAAASAAAAEEIIAVRGSAD